jgi:chaperone modulatory protein CbpM
MSLLDQVLEGQLLHDQVHFGFAEFAAYCRIEHGLLIELVEVGVLEPSGGSSGDWTFLARDLRRARTALRLARDLGVNYQGAAIILDLLDDRAALLAKLREAEALDLIRK